jgi:accessory gene regulator B
MFHSLANRIASIFVLYGESSEDDRDIYVYACETLLSTMSNVALGVLVVALFGRLVDGIVFMAGFALLRRHTGGHHARTHLNCVLAFTLVLICGMIVLSLASRMQIEIVLPISASVIFLGIFTLAPVEHKNKPLNADKRSTLKKKSRWISFILLSFSFIDYFVLGTDLGLVLSLSMISVFGSMVYANIYKWQSNLGKRGNVV